MTKNIGFIGLGRMGRGVASNLLKAGHAVCVCDLSPEAVQAMLNRGATSAASALEVAQRSELIFTSLPTPEDVERVAFGEDGLVKGLGKSTAWFDLSTNAVDAVRRIHERLVAYDVHFFDAPLSGGPVGAANGELAIWVGGDADVFEAYRGILESVANQVRYIGPIGAGTVTKLAHNVASISMSAVLAEVMSLGVKAGVDPLALWEAIRSGAAGRSRSFDSIAQRFLQGRLDPPNFALDLAHKDMGLGMRLARDSHVPMRLCNLVFEEITEAVNRGWGARDSQSFLLLQQQRAGIAEFKVSKSDVDAAISRT